MTPQPDWASAFAIMWNKLIDDTLRCGGYGDDEAAHMRVLLDRHLSMFDRPVPACLLHMDVWAQNILADKECRLTGLLDWDRALWGDPEIEFAVLDYCGISEPAFWEGYGADRDRSPDAEVRRIFYLLYEVQKYILIRRLRTRSPARADEYRRQSLALARRLE
jgi:aminoglycoside phosphotransferase (APT) family kinase protein